jgi:hypothetical protein
VTLFNEWRLGILEGNRYMGMVFTLVNHHDIQPQQAHSDDLLIAQSKDGFAIRTPCSGLQL